MFLQPVQNALSWSVGVLVGCLCDLIPSFLWSDLPRCPPGTYPIDFALSSLPLGRSARCPPWWSSLLLMPWHIQRLCRPDRYYPIDPSPGASWYSRSARRSD
ncbi:hypothetical protein G6F50_015447 [Rhizopus delemar]|uniref:Uncharacterized protein n=1 Tax=Rhizopus delemar TaxID=936053 RepID=A0A9P6XXS4_9FUNG|nr:hypothetical protein G6F50_015447 [Rhizopus delemar]